MFHSCKLRMEARGSCSPNYGKIAEKAIMDAFSLTQALLNEYGEKVNGSLIHANRLAFSRTQGYLCIAAAPWRVMRQSSLYERESTTSNRNVKYNSNT